MTTDEATKLWAPIHSPYKAPYTRRLSEILLSWSGTPYRTRSAIKQRGADCIGFVEAVVDELYRKKFNVQEPNSSLAGLSHSSDKFIDFYARARRLWPNIASKTVDVGDIILDRPESGLAHIYIVGASPFVAWHCTPNSGVRPASFQSLGTNLKFFRLLNKDTWR